MLGPRPSACKYGLHTDLHTDSKEEGSEGGRRQDYHLLRSCF